MCAISHHDFLAIDVTFMAYVQFYLSLAGLALVGLALVGLALVGLALGGLTLAGLAPVGLALAGLALARLALVGLALVGLTLCFLIDNLSEKQVILKIESQKSWNLSICENYVL